MTTEAQALEAMLAAERQWRADVLEVLLRGVGYLEALAEASHGQLAALAEIRSLLTVDQASETGEELEAVSVAELLERIAEDVEEAGQAAHLLTEDAT
jgi:hypothetical protein